MTPRQTARLLSLVAGLIGAVGMVGWIAGIEALKRLHPSWVTMKAVTAAALMPQRSGTRVPHDQCPTDGNHSHESRAFRTFWLT